MIVVVGRRLGTEIFPSVDAGQFQLRLRAPAGTRVESTEQIALASARAHQARGRADNVEITLGFVGVQRAELPVNLIYLWNGGPEEAVLQVQLKPGAGIAIEEFKERLRQAFAAGAARTCGSPSSRATSSAG